MKFVHDHRLKDLTTMKIGGPARYFVRAETEDGLMQAVRLAQAKKLKWFVVGDGSNLVPSDEGFDGLIIKNEIGSFRASGQRVFVGAGNNLLAFIRRLNRLGLAGMEKMAGIPGTVGGAIYGCAGAYGQEIKDCLVRVKVFYPSTLRRGSGQVRLRAGAVRWLTKAQCRFSYRESVFKKQKHWVILGAEFHFQKEGLSLLVRTSRDIIKLREQKYWPGLLCPGSFFKNIVVNDIQPAALRKKFLSTIDPSKIMYGKVPTGYLLEVVGAKGMKRGGIRVAEHHANLIFNSGRGKTADIHALAQALKEKVKKRFGITLEEEVRYI